MTTHTNRWRTEPHVRMGDPCFLCGIPMTPGSREYEGGHLVPEGHRMHGGHGLCRRCYRSPEGKALVAQARNQQGDR